MSEREYLVELGRNVRMARNRMGLSSERLSAMLGFDVKTISRIENARKVPRITTLKKIAEALKTDVRHLLP